MKMIMEQLLDETVSVAAPSIDTFAAEDDGLRNSLPFQRTHPRSRLVESRGGFNLVRYNGHIFALAEELGSLDVAVEADTLLERSGPDAVILAATIEEARKQVRRSQVANVSDRRGWSKVAMGSISWSQRSYFRPRGGTRLI